MIAPIPAPDVVTEQGGSVRSGYLWLAATSGALGGLLFGYDWVVIGGAKPFYEIYFHLTSPSLQGWAMSCALIGCLIGALTSGGLSDRLGRKRLLTLAAIVFAVSSLGTGVATHFDAFVAWRILGGYGEHPAPSSLAIPRSEDFVDRGAGRHRTSDEPVHHLGQ